MTKHKKYTKNFIILKIKFTHLKIEPERGKSKIVAFDKKARDGASIIRQDLLGSTENKKIGNAHIVLKNKDVGSSERSYTQ